ncbi:MAG: hypothetical protein J0M15_00720 [Deltaproteobacteria bacterium]|jgi:hypothetical protein|nr:hypothetical protein [Deltaproteobacteria bacterium]
MSLNKDSLRLFIVFLLIGINIKVQARQSPVFEKSEYFSNFELRNDRKLGAGIGLLGIFGYLGGVVDINFNEDNSSQLGFGKGYGFNSFFLGWKKSFRGKYFTPYFTLGYSRFYSSVVQDLQGNSYVLDQVLSKSELKQGQFGIDFLNTHFGMQYNQLDGDLMGNTFYLEFNFLFSLARSLVIPAASVGTIYYF